MNPMLRKNEENTLVKFNTALNQLKEKGLIKKILNRYTAAIERN